MLDGLRSLRKRAARATTELTTEATGVLIWARRRAAAQLTAAEVAGAESQLQSVRGGL